MMFTKGSFALALGATIAVGAAATFLPPRQADAENMSRVPAPAVVSPPGEAKSETAVFAGGCFWGVQGVFQHVKGVTSAVSGYTGGRTKSPSYEEVSTGDTGHAESVKVTFDPQKISYGRLLQIYFSVVTDPTTLNAQGPDEGTQYRSDLFVENPEQAKVAKDYIAQLSRDHAFHAPIVTRVTTAGTFYPAEGYHQNFLTEHPHNPYIAENDIPKVQALKALFPSDYKSDPALVASRN